ERITDPSSPFYEDLTISPLLSVEYIAFRSDVAPFDDPAIRQALALGFPRQRVASVSLNGRVGEANGVVPDGMLGKDEWLVESSPDLERARQLISESSYGSAGNVPPITIYSAASLRATTFRDAIAENLGLRVDVVFVDWQSFLNGLQNREYPAYLLYWGADFPDPESILLTLFGTDSADNYVEYSNSEFDGLLEQASREADPEARIGFYAEANEVLMDDAVVIPLFYDVAYTLVKPWVQGIKMTPLGLLYLDSVSIAEEAGQ
ncbi:MAG: ABC transporter substrate-binding protein, partial [Thermomicrobiales bacterium]